jgi:16S rRNA processing protein RimM
MSKKIIIGAIGDAYGIKGWSHLISFADPHSNIFNYPHWQIQIDRQDQDRFTPLKIESHKPHGNGFVVKIENCNDRDQALLFKGKSIAVERTELPATKKGVYYWSDLVGLTVINTKNQSFGVIDHLFDTGSNDVIVTVIETKIDKHIAKQNIYIPYLKSVVKEIDLDKKMMLVEWDLNE